MPDPAPLPVPRQGRRIVLYRNQEHKRSENASNASGRTAARGNPPGRPDDRFNNRIYRTARAAGLPVPAEKKEEPKETRSNEERRPIKPRRLALEWPKLGSKEKAEKEKREREKKNTEAAEKGKEQPSKPTEKGKEQPPKPAEKEKERAKKKEVDKGKTDGPKEKRTKQQTKEKIQEPKASSSSEKKGRQVENNPASAPPTINDKAPAVQPPVVELDQPPPTPRIREGNDFDWDAVLDFNTDIMFD